MYVQLKYSWNDQFPKHLKGNIFYHVSTEFCCHITCYPISCAAVYFSPVVGSEVAIIKKETLYICPQQYPVNLHDVPKYPFHIFFLLAGSSYMHELENPLCISWSRKSLCFSPPWNPSISFQKLKICKTLSNTKRIGM